MDIKLRPCPICSGLGKFLTRTVCDTDFFRIKCQGCGIATYPLTMKKERAARIWNTGAGMA